jgi:hypothetical protein
MSTSWVPHNTRRTILNATSSQRRVGGTVSSTRSILRAWRRNPNRPSQQAGTSSKSPRSLYGSAPSSWRTRLPYRESGGTVQGTRDEVDGGAAAVASVRGRTVTLKVKYADFQIITRGRSLTAPVAPKRFWRRSRWSCLRRCIQCRRVFAFSAFRCHPYLAARQALILR